MSDTAQVDLPSSVDLLYPTLVAMNRFGGPTPIVEIDEAVAGSLKLSGAQLEARYSKNHTSGTIVRHRLMMARSVLRKLDMVEQIRRGVWQITEAGIEFLERDDAEDELRHREHEMRVGEHPTEFLDDVLAKLSANDPPVVQLSVRALLSKWGVARRGAGVVSRIERDLLEAGLRTVPRFDLVPIDTYVTFEKVSTSAVAEVDEELDVPAEATRTIGAVASPKLIDVNPDVSVTKVQSLMIRYDFSQIPVIENGRKVRGIVTWESIAKAALRGGEIETARDVWVPVGVVPLEEPLLDHVDTIAEQGCLLVRGEKELVIGIVTTADLAQAFASLAKPFVKLEEIEVRLRDIIDRTLDIEEVTAFLDNPEAEIAGPDDLTFGDYVYLFQNPEVWGRFGLNADRTVFRDLLKSVNEARNAVMHFHSDPLEDEKLEAIDSLVRWLRELEASRA